MTTAPADRDDGSDDEADDDDDELAAAATATAAPSTHALTVDAAHAGERIDAVIAAALPDVSRAQVQRLIDDAHVQLNRLAVRKPGQRVRAGDAIVVAIPAPTPVEIVAEDLP